MGTQAATAQAELEAVERAKAEAQQRAANADQKLDELHSLEAEYTGYREAHAAAGRLVALIWPSWVLTGEFSRWREKLESGIYAPEAPASAMLLFSAIHGYNAALREAGDSRVLLDSLRELSRRLFTWLRELGDRESEAAAHAQEWAVQINRECTGKAEVEVPIPGNPADTSWMLFPPRTGGSDIVSIQTWCVRDGQKRPINKAQVTV